MSESVKKQAYELFTENNRQTVLEIVEEALNGSKTYKDAHTYIFNYKNKAYGNTANDVSFMGLLAQSKGIITILCRSRGIDKDKAMQDLEDFNSKEFKKLDKFAEDGFYYNFKINQAQQVYNMALEAMGTNRTYKQAINYIDERFKVLDIDPWKMSDDEKLYKSLVERSKDLISKIALEQEISSYERENLVNEAEKLLKETNPHARTQRN